MRNLCQHFNASTPECKKHSKCASVLVLLCAASGAEAETPAVTLFDMALEDLMQIKITASTLTDESLKTAPASVTVFTRKDIQDLGVRSLDQLMNHVPGYQNAGVSDSNSSLTHYSSRGRRIVGATREVLVLLDGVRLNDERTGGLLLDNISLGNIERVKFMRGPGSSIYGSNAFMGVIQLVSSSTRNDVTASVGNVGWRSASVSKSWGTAGGDHGSLYINADHRDGDERAVYNPATKTYTDSQSPYSGKELYLQAQWGNWRVKWHPREVTTEDFYQLGRFDNAVNSNAIRQNPFFIGYERVLDDNWTVEANAQYFTSDVFYRYNFGTPAAPKIYELFADTGESQLASTLFWQRHARKGLLGLELRRPDLSSRYVETIAGVSRAGAALGGKDERLYHSVFAQWSSELWSGASYILGGRYDDDAFVGSHFSPRTGLIQQLSESQTLKLLYGEAFRSPTRVELDSIVSGGAPQVGNPNIKPEIAKTTELIWSHYRDQHYLSATLFNTRISDPITITQVVPRVYQNAGEESVSGVEIEWLWSFATEWKWRSNASFFRPSNDLTPEVSRLWGVDLTWKAQPWTVTLSDIYKNSVKDADNSSVGFHRLSASSLASLYANYRVSEKWNVFLRVDNLLDRQTLAPANSASNTVGLPVPGRALELGIRWQFD